MFVPQCVSEERSIIAVLPRLRFGLRCESSIPLFNFDKALGAEFVESELTYEFKPS